MSSPPKCFTHIQAPLPRSSSRTTTSTRPSAGARDGPRGSWWKAFKWIYIPCIAGCWLDARTKIYYLQQSSGSSSNRTNGEGKLADKNSICSSRAPAISTPTPFHSIQPSTPKLLFSDCETNAERTCCYIWLGRRFAVLLPPAWEFISRRDATLLMPRMWRQRRE